MSEPRVVVVGLGPAGADFLLPVARAAIAAHPRRFARTLRHPAVSDLAADGVAMEGLDRHYERAATLDDAYRGIVDELVTAAHEHGTVVYAVPGNPAVAERTPALLRSAGVDVTVVPGLSFADLAWSRLGVDPLAGARVVDGRSIGRADVMTGGPLLIAQCDRPDVLSEVKLALLEELGPDTPVTVLQRLGGGDEAVTTLALESLDREVEPDHLTSVFVDLGDGAGDEFVRFVALIERLRGPGGCPWDAEQTHHSLVRHLVEETYEVVEAIEALPPDAPAGEADPEVYRALEEELGDLAAQIVFHATFAREAGAFTVREVLRGIHDKLVRRHPHVFGDLDVDGADEVVANWEQIKRQEKAERRAERQARDQVEEGSEEPASLLGSVPPGLPSLLYAHKLYRKASSAGLGLMTAEEAARAAAQAASALATAPDGESDRLVGEALAALALVARRRGFDAESALRGWAARFRDRFSAMERLARERGIDLDAGDSEMVSALWLETGGLEPGRGPAG